MPNSFSIRAAAHTYDILIARNAVSDFVNAQPDALLLCDTIFAPHWEQAGRTVIGLTATEANKTLDACTRTIALMREQGFSRADRLVAIGGGIVQDVACFVASVYMRGVPWDYGPTTLLSMADSCIGGKSSINVGRYKNIAGTFHPPGHILIDTGYVSTQDRDQVAGGLCEAVKICFARGPDAFAAYCAHNPQPDMDAESLSEIVTLSLQSKRWFIEIDEFDRNERLTLNFGHTFGHALEAATGFQLNHGLAVGIGMLCALEFARRETGFSNNRTAQLDAYLRALLKAGTSVQAVLGALDRPAFEQAFLSDKKHDRDTLRLVLPQDAGGLPLARVSFPRTAQTMQTVVQILDTLIRSLET